MNTYERYIWLVDTIRRHGRLTYDEISSKWDKCSRNDEHLPLEKRTFLNHIKAVETLMGIVIRCDMKDSYRYYIEDEGSCDGIRSWLMESMAVSNTLSESRDLSDRIMLEQIPSGQEHLSTILDAMHSNTVISIQHQSYWKDEPTIREVHPYGLRLADRRWYLIGYIEERDNICVFGLDRIVDIDITERKFEYPDDFNLEEYFRGCCGVIKLGDIETIRVLFTDKQQKYVDSLPLHESQRMIERNDDEDYAIFEYNVRPTIDFTMKLLAYGSSVEVLSPESYRQEMASYAKQMNETYNQ